MIGVCTGDLDLDHCRHVFCSMIGLDSNSWGISYTGQTQHKQLKESYSSKFGQGAIIGVHLDMWHGTLSFYKNRKPLGVLSKVLSFNVISFCLYFWPIYICLVLVNVEGDFFNSQIIRSTFVSLLRIILSMTRFVLTLLQE